jgi:histidyl-tRNA synthetase
MLADAEVLKVFSELLQSFQLDFCLRVNDRRLLDLAVTERAGTDPKLFNSICASLDKLDKVSWDEVTEELTNVRGLNSD